MQTLTDKNFDETIKQGTYLVDFTGKNCVPCKTILPLLQEIDGRGKINVVKVETDDNLKLVSRFSIMSVPTLIIMKDGKEVARKSGFDGRKRLLEFVGNC